MGQQNQQNPNQTTTNQQIRIERTVVLTIPKELGLSTDEVDKLKANFQNQIVQTMTPKTTVSRDTEVVYVVVVVVVYTS